MGNIEIGRIGNESLVVEDADNDGIYDAGETVGIRVESEARGDRVDRDYARVQQMMDRLGVYWNMEIPDEIIRRVFAYTTLEFPQERFRARLELEEGIRQAVEELHHERGVVRSSDPPSIFCREENITLMPIVTSAGEVFEVGERVRFVGGKETRVITGFILRGDSGEYAAVWADGTLSCVGILEHG